MDLTQIIIGIFSFLVFGGGAVKLYQWGRGAYTAYQKTQKLLKDKQDELEQSSNQLKQSLIDTNIHNTQRIDALRRDLDFSETRANRLENELEASKARANRLEVELDNLRSAYQDALKQIAELSIHLNQRDSRIAERDSKIAELEQLNRRAAQRISELEQEIALLKAQLQEQK